MNQPTELILLGFFLGVATAAVVFFVLSLRDWSTSDDVDIPPQFR